jgi:hypothetical protein
MDLSSEPARDEGGGGARLPRSVCAGTECALGAPPA